MRLPDLLDPPHLPLAELCAARLDGELFPLGRGWTAPDAVPGAADRAAAALSGLPDLFIAERETALWIWGAIDAAPEPPRVCLPLARPRSGLRGRGVREVVIGDAEVARLGGRRVTTPLRTAVDLARRNTEWTAESAAAVRRLVRLAGIDGAALLRALEASPRAAHTARARTRLERIRGDGE
jgi:hypothetical protein